MRLPLSRSTSAVRMSFGPLTDTATIAAACDAIARCGAALAALLPTSDHAIPDSAALDAFLRSHPDARLVGVRDAHEHAAGGGVHISGRTAINVPMAQLSAHAPLRGRRMLHRHWSSSAAAGSVPDRPRR
jgi:hypothetical protein